MAPLYPTDAVVALLDNFDNPMGARIDQDRAAVHDRVSVVPNAIFRRHIVIGNAFFRQHCADPDILTILIGRPALFDHITAKARTLVDAENPAYTADHTANDPADHGTDWAGCPLTVSRTALHSAGDPLGVGHDGECHRRGKNSGGS
jgi:hypothetical protein